MRTHEQYPELINSREEENTHQTYEIQRNRMISFEKEIESWCEAKGQTIEEHSCSSRKSGTRHSKSLFSSCTSSTVPKKKEKLALAKLKVKL